MTAIVHSIELTSLIYCVILIPLLIFLSRTAWGIGKYIEAELDLKWQRERKELRKKND